MKQLVLLVGLPGSGKTSFRKQYPDWAVVSKDDIRGTIFHRDFSLDYEDAVERIFAAALVEAVDSPAAVVCVDNTNLTRAERRPLIELAQVSGREAVAFVMPLLPLEVLYERKQQQLKALEHEHPELTVGGFPRNRYETMYARYEDVREEEGFAKVVREALQPVALLERKRISKVRRRRLAVGNELQPLPLFAP
jgi:predicted kinase